MTRGELAHETGQTLAACVRDGFRCDIVVIDWAHTNAASEPQNRRDSVVARRPAQVRRPNQFVLTPDGETGETIGDRD